MRLALFIALNAYLFLREREESEAGRGEREREGDTESEAGLRVHAVSRGPGAGLKLTNQP